VNEHEASCRSLLSLAAFAAAYSSSGSVDGSVAISDHPSGGKPRTEVATKAATSGVGQTVEATVGVAARIEEKGGSLGFHSSRVRRRAGA
jgi:hypothetical protein